MSELLGAEDDLKEKLPASFVNKIREYVPTENDGFKGFKATIWCKVEDDDEAKKWLDEYAKASFTSWIVRKTYNFDDRKLQKLRFRKDYVCQLSNYHHVASEGPRNLARNCSASIVFKVKIDSKKTRRTESSPSTNIDSASSYWIIERSETFAIWKKVVKYPQA